MPEKKIEHGLHGFEGLNCTYPFNPVLYIREAIPAQRYKAFFSATPL